MATSWVCFACHDTHPSEAQAEQCCAPSVADDPDTPVETGVLRALSHAVDEIGTARELTRNGLLDDHCANAVRELRTALRMAIGG